MAGGPGARMLLELEQGGVVTAVGQLHVELATGTSPGLVRLPDTRKVYTDALWLFPNISENMVISLGA